VVDEETTFWYEHDTRSYTPTNFGDKFEGLMTLRYALAHSKNIPAVKVAEMVGYDKVAEVARVVGLNHNIQPTPAIALGAYEVTPLEIASAYTVFPNGGDLLKHGFIKAIRDGNGASAFEAKPERKAAIDPRVAYLVESMMEDVLRGSGTGAGALNTGVSLPAPAHPRATWVSFFPLREKPGLHAMAGSRDSLPRSSAWCGWASTITATSSSKAQKAPCRSGPSS
jgi:penicillin-binding protein 1B